MGVVMSGTTPRQRVLTALQCQEPDRVPWLEIVVDEDVGRKILGEPWASRAPQVHQVSADWGPIGGSAYPLPVLAERLGLDGFGYQMTPPFYFDTEMTAGREYIVDGQIHGRADIAGLRFPDPDDPARYTPVKRYLDENRGGYAVFALVSLGSDPVILGLGHEAFGLLLYDDRDFVELLFDLYNEWIVRSLRHICGLGFDFIWVCDDLAFKNGPFLSPRLFREVIMPRFRRAAEAITLPWVFHSDGNLMPILDELLSLGMNGLRPSEPGAMDIYALKKHYGRQLCLMGNIDLINTLPHGTPVEVEAEVAEKIRRLGPGGGYILSSANSITSYCRPENVLTIGEAVRRYGRYPLGVQESVTARRAGMLGAQPTGTRERR